MKTRALTIGRAVASLAILAATLTGGASAAGAIGTDPGGGGGGYCASSVHVVGTWFNNVLSPNDAIRSSGSRYLFVMQTDGNLVLYDCTGARVCWASGTAGKTGAYAEFHVTVDPTYRNTSGVWMTVETPSQKLKSYSGGIGTTQNPDQYNVSVNNGGQVWIGYKDNFNC